MAGFVLAANSLLSPHLAKAKSALNVAENIASTWGTKVSPKIVNWVMK